MVNLILHLLPLIYPRFTCLDPDPTKVLNTDPTWIRIHNSGFFHVLKKLVNFLYLCSCLLNCLGTGRTRNAASVDTPATPAVPALTATTPSTPANSAAAIAAAAATPDAPVRAGHATATPSIQLSDLQSILSNIQVAQLSSAPFLRNRLL